jgi:hypothetical protein
MKKLALVFAVVFLVFLFTSPAKTEGSDTERERRCFELLDIRGPMISEVDEALDVCKGVLSPARYAIFKTMAEDYFEKTLREAKAYATKKSRRRNQSKIR